MNNDHLKILLIGSGVIGSVYATQFGLAGHQVYVLAHGQREKHLSAHGIVIKNLQTDAADTKSLTIVDDASTQKFDLIIVAVQASQLQSVFPILRMCIGSPHTILFGNNPEGHMALPTDLPGTTQLAFPGLSGSIQDQVIEYILVDQQPTALELVTSPISEQVRGVLISRDLPIQDIADMDGWLKYHAVFISCISTAILRSNGDPMLLGKNGPMLKLMCRAIEEGFGVLKTKRFKSAPRSLTILHSRYLRMIAVNYWKKVMLSGKGELYFGSHARHAPDEVRMLSDWVLKVTQDSKADTSHISELLERQ